MVRDETDSDSIVRLRTRFSPAECWTRLETVADVYRYFYPGRFLFCRKPLAAWRRDERLVLAARWPRRQPYPYWFYGRIVANGTGSLVEGRFRWPLQARVTLAIMGVVWPALLIAAAVFGDGGELGRPKMFGMLAFILVLPFVLIWYNLWYGRRMENTVLPVLVNALEATEA